MDPKVESLLQRIEVLELLPVVDSLSQKNDPEEDEVLELLPVASTPSFRSSSSKPTTIVQIRRPESEMIT